jgi:hypothetical protein
MDPGFPETLSKITKKIGKNYGVPFGSKVSKFRKIEFLNF